MNGVTLLGPVNLPATVPFHASQMFSKNVVTLMQLMIKEGKLELDLEDEVIRDTMATHQGEVTNPKIREAMGMAATTS